MGWKTFIRHHYQYKVIICSMVKNSYQSYLQKGKGPVRNKIKKTEIDFYTGRKGRHLIGPRKNLSLNSAVDLDGGMGFMSSEQTHTCNLLSPSSTPITCIAAILISFSTSSVMSAPILITCTGISLEKPSSDYISIKGVVVTI